MRQELNDELAKFRAKVLEDLDKFKKDPSYDPIMFTNNKQGYIPIKEFVISFSRIALSFEDLLRCAGTFTKGVGERKLLHKVKDIRSLFTLQSMHTCLMMLARKLLDEYKRYQIELQMLAMVLYEWIDFYK